MPEPTPPRLGLEAFAALMREALRCPCDTRAVPLCARCECLFRLAVAAVDAVYTETELRWARQAARRQRWRAWREDETHA